MGIIEKKEVGLEMRAGKMRIRENGAGWRNHPLEKRCVFGGEEMGKHVMPFKGGARYCFIICALKL